MAPTKMRWDNKRPAAGKRYSSKASNRFVNNAKRMGSAGNYGRGTDIEEEHFEYFLIIVQELQKPAESFEERVSMATNVLQETKGEEVHLSSNQVVSKAIEALIGFAGEDHFERFLDAFGENVRPICSDPFASHVIQKLIEIAFLRSRAEHKIEDSEQLAEEPKFKQYITDQKYNMETKFSTNHQEKCAAFVERISKFLLNNLEDFVSDTFGNFVIRTCAYSLAGIHVPKVIVGLEKRYGKTKADVTEKQTLFKTPETWHEILKEFPSRLEMWPQFPDLVYKESTSALLGAICRALGKVEKNALKHFGSKIIKGVFFNTEAAKRAIQTEEKEMGNENDKKEESGSDENKKDDISEEALPPVFWNFASVRLLESLITTAGPKLYNEIYKKFFEGRFVELTNNKHGFYACKVMLKQMKDQTMFETIFEQLLEHFDRFIDNSKQSIFFHISGACLRLNAKQAAFVTALQASLHCSTAHGPERPNSFLSCLLPFKRFEELENAEDTETTTVGSVIAQDILQFKKPIFLVNCILASYPKDIAHILTTPSGSYIGDAFFKSKFIGEKSREKFMKMLDGFYMDLALSRFGSRVLENMFHVANESQKLRIAKELTSRDNKLKGTIFGRIMFNKLRLETFRLSAEQWKASWNVKDLKGDELNDILKKKKKRAASTSDETSELKKKK